MSQSVSILDCGGHQGWPHLQKQLHYCGVVILGCEVDGLLLQVIIPVNHSIKVNQSFAGGELTSSCGQVERGLFLSDTFSTTRQRGVSIYLTQSDWLTHSA